MVKADVKLHNAIFECANCGEIKLVEKDHPVAIVKLHGVKPTETKGANKDEYDMVYTTVFVDRDCFDELELTDQEPPEIAK